MGLAQTVVPVSMGRRFVALLGSFYVVSTAGWVGVRHSTGEPFLNLLIIALITISCGGVLVGGGYTLPRTDVDSTFYHYVGAWCLGGFGIMFLVLSVYHLQPADSLSNPYRGLLALTAISSVAGLGVGYHDARARTRALEVEQRNRELEQMRERLEVSNERLEQFAYAASHDLQEPLRMITSYMDLLERRYGDELDDDAEEFIAYAVDGADRMKAMIDGLLEYSRVETQGEPFEPVDLEAVVDDVQQNLEVRIEESDATVQVGELPCVQGDPRQLQQLFQNLVSNAIEYSGETAPQIRIFADRDGTQWIVSVADDGIGIPPDEQEAVFEVFRRLHSHEEHAGTGIGLALCKRIVERHDGEISIDSEPGSGTTVSFSLPAATDHTQ